MVIPDETFDDLLEFLDEPTIEKGQKIISKLTSFKEYPKPVEGIWNNVIKNSYWNWIESKYSIDEW